MPENLEQPEPVVVTPPAPTAIEAPEPAPSEEVVAPPPAPEQVHPEPPNPDLFPEAEPPAPPEMQNVPPVAPLPAPVAAAPEPGSPEQAAPEESSPEAVSEAPPSNKRWYVVKVQSGREDTIKEAIERRVKIEGLEEYYGQIVIPTETSYEMVKGKRAKRTHKLFPGYLMVEVEYNDRMLYLFRETSGVGDFVGHTVINGVNRPPTPMTPQEVERMMHKVKPGPDQEAAGPTKISKPRNIDVGDRVRVNDGTFAGMEGDVKEIVEAKGQVKVELHIFGRPVIVEQEYWQVERV